MTENYLTKKMFALLLSAFLAVGLCLSAFAAVNAQPTNIRMSSSSAVLSVGGTRQLSATFSPSGATASILWRSSDPSVASVDSYGLVSGVSRGSATIYASTPGGLETYCQFTVRSSSVPIERMETSLGKMTVRQGQTRELWLWLTPVDATDKSVSWSSSDTGVAQVENNGSVVGVAPGVATITVTAPSGASASCVVTVVGKGASVTTETEDDGETPPTVRTAAQSSADVSKIVATVKQAAAVTGKGKTGYADVKNMQTISPAEIGTAATAASESARNVFLRFLTADSSGKTLASFSFDPQKAKARATSLATGVSASSQNATSAADSFKKHFQNKIVVVDCAQSGAFGFPVQIMAKADLSGMGAENLHAYTYDPLKNTYAPLAVSGLSAGTGMLQFTTQTGGLIVFSDGELASK